MSNKEVVARIKINKLLEAVGWRFFPSDNMPANIRLEPSVTIKKTDLDALGENFLKTNKGFIDFLRLDSKGFPLIVLEAKSEDKKPLIVKEQARKYSRSLNSRFVIFPMAICTTSGTWNVTTPTLLLPSPHRTR
jgi:type I restriction enzyme, R subunit